MADNNQTNSATLTHPEQISDIPGNAPNGKKKTGGLPPGAWGYWEDAETQNSSSYAYQGDQVSIGNGADFVNPVTNGEPSASKFSIEGSISFNALPEVTVSAQDGVVVEDHITTTATKTEDQTVKKTSPLTNNGLLDILRQGASQWKPQNNDNGSGIGVATSTVIDSVSDASKRVSQALVGESTEAAKGLIDLVKTDVIGITGGKKAEASQDPKKEAEKQKLEEAKAALRKAEGWNSNVARTIEEVLMGKEAKEDERHRMSGVSKAEIAKTIGLSADYVSEQNNASTRESFAKKTAEMEKAKKEQEEQVTVDSGQGDKKMVVDLLSIDGGTGRGQANNSATGGGQ